MKKITQVVTGLFLAAALVAPQALADKGHHGHKACKADIEKFCAGKHGADKKACVEQNKAQFSQPCQEAMAKHEHHEGAPEGEKH